MDVAAIPRSHAAVVASIAIGFVILGWAMRDSVRPSGWEATIITAARRFNPPWAHGLTKLFDRDPFVAFTLTLAGVALVNRRWSLAVAGTVGCVAAVYATEHVFKRVFEGYPSAHVTAAAACATFAWCILRKRRFVSLLVFVIPITVAWAAIAVRMHYPAEVFGGLFLGPLVVGVAVLLMVHAVSLATRLLPVSAIGGHRTGDEVFKG